MTLRVALIADDLTGALDSATPFAMAGLKVAVAARPSHIGEAMQCAADVVAVNTATRSLPSAEAARIVGACAAQLGAARPEIAFKKIDSRLKGNVRAEVEAAARAFASEDIVVAPAVPDQQRFTAGRAMTGRGVPVPLPVAPCVPPGAEIIDAASDADLDRLAAGADWSGTLAVGARGLGAALARRHGDVAAPPFVPEERTLFVIGSVDPITVRQAHRLAGRAEIREVAADTGSGTLSRLPAMLRSARPMVDPVAAIARLAAVARRAIDALAPGTLVTSGGDTSLALLDALGVGVVFPEGEASPGLPWFVIGRASRPNFRCVVKSGGFGGPETLRNLLPG